MSGGESGMCPACGTRHVAIRQDASLPFCSPACKAQGPGTCHGFVSDNSAVLCKLLAEARGIIADHVSIGVGDEWMEKLHRCPQFKDPDPPQ